MRAVKGVGTVMAAEYVNFAAGVSCMTESQLLTYIFQLFGM